MEIEKNSLLQLRSTLVTERIWEIYEENRRGEDKESAYWTCASSLALLKDADLCYLRFDICKDIFKEGYRDFCLLYAQLLLLKQIKNDDQDEYFCTVLELLVQIYCLRKDNEHQTAFRDALYWFYSDYCGLYINYALKLLDKKRKLCVCGPALFMEQSVYESDSAWIQHKNDMGLYMGNRYRERLVQTLDLVGFSSKEVKELLELLFLYRTEDREPGYVLSTYQLGCLEQLKERGNQEKKT